MLDVLLERDAEIAALARSLAEAGQGRGQVVMIEAAPGLGKTELLRHTREKARSEGLMALSARAAAPEHTYAFGQLLEPVLLRSDLPAGAAIPVRERLFGSPPPPGPASYEFLSDLYRFVIDLTAVSPVVILVDDWQWLDPPSAQFLGFLARRQPDVPQTRGPLPRPARGPDEPGRLKPADPVPGGPTIGGVSKRLIVCCDGTWNTAGQERDGVVCPTNVVKIRSVVPETGSDGVPQHVYYREGVGTMPWERLRGGVFGVGLSRNVLDAYGWLIKHFEPGDQIFLFGFSRGAFTVRSLAGLIRNSGILRAAEASRVREAYSLYRSKAGPDAAAALAFRDAYSQETGIRFIGVWDTVGELGIPLLGPRWLKPFGRLLNRPWTFHDTQLSSRVEGAFHALAIDEERSVFEPTLWHQQPDAVGQVLEQVWFTGVHCSVGGGLASSALSDLALIWMAERAGEFGLDFAPGAFDPPKGGALALAPDPSAAFVSSRTGVYRLSGPFHRPIGQARAETSDRASGPPDGNESISASATARYEDDPRYRPPGLVDYLRT